MNLAAINYYFRDKEELYWEVLRHAMQASLRNENEASSQVLSPHEQLTSFIVDFLRNLLDPKRPEWHGKLIARELGDPTRLLDLVVESNIRPKGESLRKILRQIWEGKPSPEMEALICSSIMAQCLYYRQNRAVVERLYPGLLTSEATIHRLARHISEFSLSAVNVLKEKHGKRKKRR